MQRVRWNSQTIVEALASLEAGLTVGQVSANTGVPVTSIKNWQHGRIPKHAARALAGIPSCDGCGEQEHEFELLDPANYAYVLGVYLGDGWLQRSGRTMSFRVASDDRQPGIIAEVGAAIELLRGRPPGTFPSTCGQRCTITNSSWKCWPCYLPQHGPGKKQDRPIVLTDWQRALVEQAPGSLLRGLIHTDGWRGLNKVTVKGKEYAYPRYQFSSRSDDIRGIFTWGCDLLGIAWRPWGPWHISVARREAVMRLDEFVGLKY